jgi:uncharacterized protein DUF3606
MRYPKRPQIRNKVDLTDKRQVRALSRRFGLSEAELTQVLGKAGNSLAAITKELALQRMAKAKTPALAVVVVTKPTVADRRIPEDNLSA